MPHKPSSLYGGSAWQLGLRASKWIPGKPLLGGLGGSIYRLAKPARLRIVENNLRPLSSHPESMARKLFSNFGRKLVDLWRFESGEAFSFGKLSGWEHYEEAHKESSGILLATIHLGNWEIGATLFLSKGISLTVLTAEEPDKKLTAARSAARLAHGIKTLVVGSDPFSFVEVVRQLQSGGNIAALIDRPNPGNGLAVSLCGRQLLVSPGPAELARASGCAVLPVYIVRGSSGYEATILPRIPYNRAQLRNPEAKQQFTTDLMRAFEPALKRYPDQWYQFVPVWL